MNSLNHKSLSDLSKPEELLYQIQEMQYNLSCYQESLEEAMYHLRRFSYHAELMKECAGQMEVLNVG